MDFRKLLEESKYDFLRTHPRLGKRIMLLGISGSYGYGTNREGSDIDFRGVTLNLSSDLLGLTSFDQYEDAHTDTVIYSFKKLVNLLLNCNPNTDFMRLQQTIRTGLRKRNAAVNFRIVRTWMPLDTLWKASTERLSRRRPNER